MMMSGVWLPPLSPGTQSSSQRTCVICFLCPAELNKIRWSTSDQEINHYNSSRKSPGNLKHCLIFHLFFSWPNPRIGPWWPSYWVRILWIGIPSEMFCVHIPKRVFVIWGSELHCAKWDKEIWNSFEDRFRFMDLIILTLRATVYWVLGKLNNFIYFILLNIHDRSIVFSPFCRWRY